MNWAPSEKLLTIKDIAQSISFDRSEDGISRTMRQVRHWTQNDLLRTVGDKHTGKGIPRLYEDDRTLEIAAVLMELSRYGTTVDVMKHVADELWDTDEGLMAISAAQISELISFLQVSWKSDPKTGYIIGANVELFEEYEIISYSKKGELPLDTDATSSVLVNMSAVMDRVYKNWQE